MEIIARLIKPISGYDGYYISTDGIVFSTRRSKEMVPLVQENKCGYNYVNLYNNNGCKHHRVHRLVAQEFIPNPHNLPIVGHIDNVKTNNTVYNLEYTTISENTKKAFDDGLAKNASGYDDSQSIPVVCENLNTGEILYFGSISECSRSLNISKSTIARQCKGETKADYRSKYKFKFQ